MKIGIFGGTFDPVHAGHRRLVQRNKQVLNLDQVLVIPAFVSPFKTSTPPIASGKDRVEMAKLAFSQDEGVSVSPMEVDREGVSYTIDTILQIKETHPDDELFLLLTEESSRRLTDWEGYRKMLALVKIAIDSQVGIKIWGEEDILEPEDPWIDICSTKIRERLQKGESCQEFLSPKVLDYILDHDLYS